MKNFKHLSFLFIILFVCTITIGCHNTGNDNTPEDFHSFTNDIFVNEVQSDSITLNYTLAEPKNYGITDFVPSLGNYSINELENNLILSENYLAKLKTFDYKELTNDQKLTYDILKSVLNSDIEIGDFLLYQESLSPTIGIQAQLPVLFAEYNFYTKTDIDHYISLLPSTYTYFKQIIDMEQLKSKKGLFMSDFAVDDIISQCESFIGEKEEDNFLITVFNKKISSYHGLTEEEIKNYKQANKKAVLNYVIPAYKLLIDGLTNLKGTGRNQGGLCNFKNGKEYYEILVKTKTGSSKTIEELIRLLDNTIDTNILKMQLIALKDRTALDQMTNIEYNLTDPEKIITYLKEAIEKDYPTLDNVNCTIKYVDESLEDHLSPAFYLTPALDHFTENNIYINKGEQNDLSSIFTTLAHEGYPGHLYQCVYFNEQNPDPIRSIFNFGGYSEGWATYVELNSYYLAGFEENVASLLSENMAATLAMYARIDIGVNYEGWLKEDVFNYLSKRFEINDEDIANQIFTSMVEEPANYLQYTIGYLEILELKNKASKELGKNFVLKDFHEFFLKTGPAPFDIINDRLDIWLKSQK